ncbi:MAG: 16S rRNA (cytidine(1402)-2'-O)-methyltransferase [Oscillospiraceae bacterium]|jgi:16S rRNA (cytidine1402-2'-O)-methyltransferase|nr:16S rRNA (cytidine(1402)-2'-O)-methyltransferase [Oscillospiraceae bacterium]
MAGRLYVVGTPIGNLGDFSARGREVLTACDFIAAEDTRVTAKLLARFEIRRPLVSYHAHNQRDSGEKILARLLAGEHCALVTDAGMPAISDPGELLVRDARVRGIAVEAVPGPTAFATALAVSGMPSGRFCFEGFLSTNTAARRAHIASLVHETRTLIFYEAPHKLPYTLRDLHKALGDRDMALCRELTKLHEEVLRLTLGEAVAHVAEHTPRGEYVLVIAGATPQEPVVLTLDDAVALAQAEMAQGASPTAAAKSAAKQSGQPRSAIYQQLTRRA